MSVLESLSLCWLCAEDPAFESLRDGRAVLVVVGDPAVRRCVACGFPLDQPDADADSDDRLDGEGPA